MTTRRIWLLWTQGWEEAPAVVRLCRDSWQRHNPGYEVVVLDRASLLERTSLDEHVDLTRADMPVQKLAVLGRLELLARYGGIWADATVACVRPLDEWLPLPEGDPRAAFFAFKDPGPDRMMSNWFIAADQRSLILRRLRDRLLSFFVENHFRNQHTRFGKRMLEWLQPRLAQRLTTTLWAHSWPVRRGLGVYPYFIAHYTFNRLMMEDAQCRALWDRVPYHPAAPPHALQRQARESGDASAARALVASGDAPLYKLDWRIDPEGPYWRAALSALEERT